ncbi:MAG: C25 family cysteine peptidase [Planctomycetaceae bacterium]|jgi:hypothetical protein|nr:C25 family cysteine peptidase [Planctomycetaceae bacterium]
MQNVHEGQIIYIICKRCLYKRQKINIAVFVLFSICLFQFTTFAAQDIAVVCSRPFHASLATWIRYRSEQGYTVHVIVEPFGSDTVTAQKIKERITEVHRKTPLAALLLVGRSSEKTVPSPLLPCRIIQQFGTETQLASDDWYADIDEDGLPDFAVGRFPVALKNGGGNLPDTAALDSLIQRTIEYESLPPDVWCRQMQLAAGVGNFSPLLDSVIESSARYILSETFPASYALSLIQADWRSPFCPFPLDFSAELNQTLDAGALFWVYLGHGTHRQIEPLYLPQGYLPLSLSTKSPASGNGRSVSFLFCCYGGSLDRDTPSLGEELVLSGRSVASVAPSRTAMPYGMSVLAVEMLQTFVQHQTDSKPLTLGQLMLESKHRVLHPVSGQTSQPRLRRPVRESVESFAKMLDPNPQQLPVQLAEHTAMFHLFGDPLLRLPLPHRLEFRCPSRVRAGQMLRISGQTDIDCRNVDLELLLPLNQIVLRSPQRQDFRNDKSVQQDWNTEYRKANSRLIERYRAECTGGKFECEIPLPKDLSGNYVIRGFAKTADRFAVNSVTFRCIETKAP